MKLLLIIIFSLICSLCFCQSSTIAKKIAKETTEVIGIKSIRSAISESIESYTRITIKNGLGKTIRIRPEQMKKILNDIYKTQGEEALHKVGNKLKSYSGTNYTNIKGFLAEELHKVGLHKIEGVTEIKSNIRDITSKSVQETQKKIIKSIGESASNLRPHKKIEIDLLAKYKGQKFSLEVKNIDMKLSRKKFAEIKSQLSKQVAYGKENGINHIFWSNIGSSKLSTHQIKELEELGVTIFQHGSISPIINAKINLTQLKIALLSI